MSVEVIVLGVLLVWVLYAVSNIFVPLPRLARVSPFVEFAVATATAASGVASWCGWVWLVTVAVTTYERHAFRPNVTLREGVAVATQVLTAVVTIFACVSLALVLRAFAHAVGVL